MRTEASRIDLQALVR